MKAPGTSTRAVRPGLMATGTIRSARTGAPVARFAAKPKAKPTSPPKGPSKRRE